MEILSSILGAAVGGLIGASSLAISKSNRSSQDNIRAITELSSGVKHIGIELERFRQDMKVMIEEQKEYVNAHRQESIASHNMLNARLTSLEKEVAVISSKMG
jgi:uncharacterized coiled-coil protein SlyX